ncbi:MAG: hypothetical protein R2799_01015 [Crocinitomicaceae bacterium]
MRVFYARFYPFLHFIFAIGLTILLFLANRVAFREPEVYEITFIIVLCIRGSLFIGVPYFEFFERELVIYNRFFGKQKVYKFDSLSDFHFEGYKLYMKTVNKSKKVSISRMFISQNDWDLMVMYLKESDLTKELH